MGEDTKFTSEEHTEDNAQEEFENEDHNEDTQDDHEDSDDSLDLDSLTDEEKNAQIKKWHAIAKRNKKKLDEYRGAPKAKDQKPAKKDDQQLADTTAPFANQEDVFVITSANLTQEEYAKAIKVAKIEGVSLQEAVDSDYFSSWRKKEQEKLKKQEAQMSASRGSGSRKAQKTFQSKNLSREDHKALWKKKMQS